MKYFNYEIRLKFLQLQNNLMLNSLIYFGYCNQKTLNLHPKPQFI